MYLYIFIYVTFIFHISFPFNIINYYNIFIIIFKKVINCFNFYINKNIFILYRINILKNKNKIVNCSI